MAALLRSSAGRSEVATTTTDLFIPSSPKSRSINSRTSRPRSPISAITLISAFVLRANIPRSVDLPTPDPAKIPILCPFPTVRSPSTAFTPSVNTSSIILRLIGSGGAASTEYAFPSLIVVLSASLPSPSKVLASSESLTCTINGCPVLTTILPMPIPSVTSYGISCVLPSLKPTTSAIIGFACVSSGYM